MGYKLTNFDYNGLLLQESYAKVVEIRSTFEQNNVSILFAIGLYPNRAISENNQCLGIIYENSFVVNKSDFNTDIKLDVYTWLNDKINEEGTIESLIFKDAEAL